LFHGTVDSQLHCLSSNHRKEIAPDRALKKRIDELKSEFIQGPAPKPPQ
jgi:pyridoxine/pyridoxamine 5'-phosphate oxidase